MWLGFGNATQIRHRTLKLTLFEHEPGESSRSFWELIGQLDRRKWSLEAEVSMEALLGFLQEAMRLRSGSRRRGRSEQDIDEDPSAGPSGVPLRGLGQSNVWLRLRREREGSTFAQPLGVMAAAVFSWPLSREGTRAHSSGNCLRESRSTGKAGARSRKQVCDAGPVPRRRRQARMAQEGGRRVSPKGGRA